MMLRRDIMENEFDSLACRGDRYGHFAAEFVKKYCSQPKLSRFPYRDLAVIFHDVNHNTLLSLYNNII